MAATGVTQLATALIPPQNIDAEESLLGGLMLAGQPDSPILLRVRATGIQPTDFYRESNGRIYRACMSLADRREPIDAITVVDELERTGGLSAVTGGAETVHTLNALVPAASNAAHYAAIVIEKAQQRSLIRAGNELVRLGFDGAEDPQQLLANARELLTRIAETGTTTAAAVTTETWTQFSAAAGDHIDCVIDRLWPEGALGFIAAPPKKGKTWIGLSLGISIATGRSFLGHFPVSKPRPVVLLALEGHRAAIRTRIGALANGIGVNPDTDQDLASNLHVVFKPRGINLADPTWIQTVRDAVDHVGAAMLIVDVLRAAAAIKENSNEEFNALRATMQPINDAGCAIALLHHFGKLTEITKERTPGERMSGTGAMYGAMDVGVFITGADKEARKLRLEFELRDLATPDPLAVKLAGDGTGDNGGFVYKDAATWQVDSDLPDEDDVRRPAQGIYDLIATNGGTMTSTEILASFEADGDPMSERTLRRKHHHLEHLGVTIEKTRGLPTRYTIPDPTDEQLALVDDGDADQLHKESSRYSPVDNAYMTPDTDPGQHPGHHVRGSEMSGVNPDQHTDSAAPRTTPDIPPMSGVNLASANGFHNPGTPDIPYGDELTADAHAHPEEPDDEDDWLGT